MNAAWYVLGAAVAAVEHILRTRTDGTGATVTAFRSDPPRPPRPTSPAGRRPRPVPAPRPATATTSRPSAPRTLTVAELEALFALPDREDPPARAA